MRYCFLCHTEFPEGTRMVMAGGTNICRPCADTPIGQAATREHDPLKGYRRRETVKTRFQSAVAHWLREGQKQR